MKFNVLGREVEVGWKHFLLYICAVLLVGIITFAVSAIYAYFSGALQEGISLMDAIYSANASLSYFITIFGQPIIAVVLLAIAGSLGMKKDKFLCRSLAAVDFIILGIFFFILAIIMFYSTGNLGVSPVIGQIGRFFSYTFGAFVLYLWLLLFIKPDFQEAKKAAVTALAYAVSFFLIIEAYFFLASYQTDTLPPSFGLIENIRSLVSYFLFGFIVLYHARGKKFDNEAYLFAGLYLADTFLFVISYLLAGEGAFAVQFLTTTILNAIGLGILFYLAGMKIDGEK